MTKTSLDVCQRALRVLGVTAYDDEPTGDDYAVAKDAMDAILLELTSLQGATISWTVETVPDALFLPYAKAVAADIAPIFSKPAPSRAAAIGQMRVYLFPDDRDNRADVDDSGTVTTAEADADLRAQYY